MNTFILRDLFIDNRDLSSKLNEIKNDYNVIKVDEKKEILFEKMRIFYGGSGMEGFEHETIYGIERRPEWLDEDLLRRGQKFAMEFLASISYAQLLSLFMMLAEENGRRSLVFTNKSNSEETAAKRYLSTSDRVKSWYSDDLLDEHSEGFRNLKAVYAYHKATSDSLNRLSEEEFLRRTDLDRFVPPARQREPTLCPVLGGTSSSHPLLEEVHGAKKLRLCQVEMSVTAFSFAGLIVLFPGDFGIPEEERPRLEGFVHLWRYIGHMLGVKDKYNTCRGSLEEVTERFRFILDYILKPLLVNTLDRKWEHMARTANQGISRFSAPTDFDSNVLFLWHLIGIDYSQIYNALSWHQRIRFIIIKYFFYHFYSIKCIRNYVNQYQSQTVRRRRKHIK